ncbi:tyrosine-type recombinase/integrase [Photobacterium leiognathi]|uniref:tyrosine-type recombinase/integrase n=1 Tax=Photobacterium leiognathi TaxID=553611 RepID=UPI000D154E69|nr:tyrosine-type recombinase/integrase [Photobacterium leiognathi]PSW41709.1 integrase [Photobacterium leiognathi subsp. mandapamensis]
MAPTDTKHLKLRGNIWWYQRRIPKDVLDQFDGQTVIFESLGTGDIREARRQRDILNGRLEERKFNAPNTNRHRFLELVQSMTEDKEHFPASWDEHYDLDKVQREGDEVFLHAYTTVNGRKDHRGRYKITLKEALKNWSTKKGKANSADNISKTKKSVDEFLKFLKLYDIQLEDISKRHVHDYIDLLLSKHATSTTRGYISRLRSIWNYCDQLGEVSTPCPFDNHSFAGGSETNKKQAFTPCEISLIKQHIADEEPIKQLLVELGVFTGCRISELCNLLVKHVINEDNIVAIYVEKGKTDAATRIVPLTNELGERINALAESKSDDDLLLGLDGKAMSRWFSRIKTTNISIDTAKSFHSFRVMFSTAMQRSEVIELKAAAILGHARGNTMTYGYYSDGYTLPQLKEAYDQCVEHIIW